MGKNIFVLFYQLVFKKNANQGNDSVRARKLLSFSVFPMSQFIHWTQLSKTIAEPIVSLCVENEVGSFSFSFIWCLLWAFLLCWVMCYAGKKRRASSKLCEVAGVASWYLWRVPSKQLRGQWQIASGRALFCPHDLFRTHPGNWWMGD